jgi:hypothetical protein
VTISGSECSLIVSRREEIVMRGTYGWLGYLHSEVLGSLTS